MKRAILLIVAIVLLISLGEAAPSVSVEPSNINVNVGDTFTVNIFIDPGGIEIFGAQFDLNYVSSNLNATNIEKGNFFDPDGFVIVGICSNDMGNCSYAEIQPLGSKTGVNKSDILATITFDAKTAGFVNLNISNVILADLNATKIPGVIIYDGTVTIDSNIPPAPSFLSSTQGNFWINYTWQAGVGKKTDSYYINVNGSWTNGTTGTYSNGSVLPHGWRNISVWAFNSSVAGGLSLTSASQNTRVANNVPLQAPIGNKIVSEGGLLTFTVSANDADSDSITYMTNATKGTLNLTTGVYSWTPGYMDAGIYVWSFTANDNYGGESNQTITVTVNDVPSSTELNLSNYTDPTTGNISEDVMITAPDGNVTVLIFNGTNATLDNRPLTNISIQSISQVNFALSGTDKFIGENLTLGPEGARFSPDLQLRFNYTDAQIPEGVPESSLTVKFYNTSAAQWEDLKIYQRDTSLNYIIVNVSHFSTFALIGIPDTPVDNNNGGGNRGNRGSGGGGGGGGGAPSDEDFKNIERQESRDVYVQKGLTVYKFTIQDIIREIGFDARTSEGLVTAKIELLKARPKKAASDAQGSVYRYFNVVVGTSGYGSSSKIENAYIVFNVPDEWLKNNSAKSVKLMKFKNNSWIDLKTENISPGTYKAYTTGFSGFAVVGITEGTQEIVTIPSSTETQATREIAVPEKESKSSVNLIIIIGVFIVLFSVSFAYLKRKELFKK